MKNKNKAYKFASKTVVSVLLFLLLLVAASMFLTVSSPTANANGLFPSLFFTSLFDYSFQTPGTQRFIGQLIGNLIAYFYAVLAIALVFISIFAIKKNKTVKTRAIIVSALAFIPGFIGLTGGAINFFGEGIAVLAKGSSTDALLAFLLMLVYLFDVAYATLATIYVFGSVNIANKVNKGLLPEGFTLEDDERDVKEAEDKVRKEEDKNALLDDIRKIVREELERLDHIAIIREEVVVKEVEKVIEKKAAEPIPAPAPVEEESEEAEEGEGKVNAPRVPFATKIAHADKDIQSRYNELKNECLAYGASSRISVSGDTFRLHRKAYVKITLVGKTLKVYYALNPHDFVNSPIPVADAGNKNTYAEIPALLKVKSNLALKRAKELVELAFAADGIAKKEVFEERDNITNIELEAKEEDTPIEEEEVVETPVVEEAPAVEEAPVIEETPAPAPVEESEEAEEGEGKSNAPRVPFGQKILQASEDIQERYNDLKNECLAYGATSRVSVAGDTFRIKRKAYVKITLVGKTLKVYFALDPNDFVNSPIPVLNAGDKSSYAEIPALLKVKSNLALKRAKDLMALAFNRDGVVKSQVVEDHDHVADFKA